MRWLINYLRSCFCEHDWELLSQVTEYLYGRQSVPCGHVYVYRCKKCGFVQKIKV